MSLYRIGVDVGGTNTDAAILDIKASNCTDRGVLASYKSPTTIDITSGIESAINAVLKASAVDRTRVLSVTIGTTHFINALVEADSRRLDRVAVIRLCGPFTREIPPFSDFPAGLQSILDGGVRYLDGGLEIDGREIASLDEGQIRQAAREIRASGVRAIALVGVFSPLDHEGIHEERCKTILLQEAPGLRVVCSHDIGPLGLLERENATILNAAILRTADHVTKSFKRAMTRLQLSCPLYLSQNDGTLIEADAAAEYPIKTFASGPTNSMTGAAFLAGFDQVKSITSTEESTGVDPVEPQVLVMDIGGTTTDVCALLPSGFPRQAPGFVEVGGVRTAFSMPEVASIGLGGGSTITVDSSGPDAVVVGPGSVGYRIHQESKVFGGQMLTATDIIVATGKAQVGEPARVQDIPRETTERARNEMNRMLESVVEQMKVSSAPVRLLLVGGGSLLVIDHLQNVAQIIRPVHEGAANAVGAAIAKVSGSIDVIEILEGMSETAVVQTACEKAIHQAVLKGASKDTVQIVEINKMPLQYASNGAIRLQIRAVGQLAIPNDQSPPVSRLLDPEVEPFEKDEGAKTAVSTQGPTIKPSLGIDLGSYRPEVSNGVWYVSDIDLELISTGCGVLGTGGGGATHHEYLKSLHALRTHKEGRMRVIPPQSLKDTDMVCFGSWYGSPSVMIERLGGGNEIPAGIEALRQVVPKKSFDAICIDEIGGGNGLSAFPTGVHLDLPVVDGDGMGRAFPTMYHVTFSVYGHSLVPCALADAQGNVSMVMNTDSPERLENLLRTAAIELGLNCAVCANPLPGTAVKSHGIPNTLSLAWYLGRAIHLARRQKRSYIDSILDVCSGKLLFTGKIIDVRRHVDGGYTMGAVIIGPDVDDKTQTSVASSSDHSHMVIPFQNEFLYAAFSDSTGSEPSQEVICTVPDLISILGQDGEAIGSQDLRYGLRVSVLALPAHRLWKTPAGLKVGGPEGFGLRMSAVGIDDPLLESRSVIEEFGR
ncbi:hypothetical protein BDV25DRAFT_170974 [Aspergillus avenaceus]|uniref:Hydantoinase/oxoprolinase n=1 Tax=Aspergillus avenaceus TaxID=36643 RepID=A0A5N6U860_ASPAV|nr:hypothetical protein BDV25DRAFT_170974 [Aspergillus avenaceus]